MTELGSTLTLPCGAALNNRIAKAAMSEHLARPDHTPSRGLLRLYQTWAKGGAGLLITGNVMIDRAHLESLANIVLDGETELSRFSQWSAICDETPSAIWMQLNHPGRQTPRNINAQPMAPSAVEPVNLFRRAKAFGHPRQMAEDEILAVIDMFANAADLAKKTGFDGVQIHAAHGYLASQFLSPLTNLRTDTWGGNLQNRARFLLQLVDAVRQRVGAAYPIGVKLNSADFQRGGMNEEGSMKILRMLQDASVDLIEISGGSYESQAMFNSGESTAKREAYFLDYARKARDEVDVPLMVTGGFRSVSVMLDALSSNALDVIGMARPFTQNPAIASDLLEGRRDHAQAPAAIPGLGRIGGVSEAMMSVVQMGLMSKGKTPTPRFGRMHAIALVALSEARSAMKKR